MKNYQISIVLLLLCQFSIAQELIKKEYEGFIKYDICTKTLNQIIDGDFEPPSFPFEGNDFQSYVAKRLIYPEICVINGVQGKITFQFVIDEKGKLTNLSVMKNADRNLVKEAARVIKEAPDWIPAKLNGRSVSISTKYQVIFILQ